MGRDHVSLGAEHREPAIGRVYIADLLDQVREQIVSHWDQRLQPRYLAVHPNVYRAVMDCKAYEWRRGLPVVLMGLEVVSSDQVAIDCPKVY